MHGRLGFHSHPFLPPARVFQLLGMLPAVPGQLLLLLLAGFPLGGEGQPLLHLRMFVMVLVGTQDEWPGTETPLAPPRQRHLSPRPASPKIPMPQAASSMVSAGFGCWSTQMSCSCLVCLLLPIHLPPAGPHGSSLKPLSFLLGSGLAPIPSTRSARPNPALSQEHPPLFFSRPRICRDTRSLGAAGMWLCPSHESRQTPLASPRTSWRGDCSLWLG